MGGAEGVQPPIQLKVGIDIGDCLCRILMQAEQSIVGTAYCFDFPDGCNVLAGRRRSHVRVRILLDEAQWVKPSCSGQPSRISELLEWGVEFKTYRPPRGDFSCMHVKSWLCDGEVYLGGSVNFTTNGVRKNEEHLLVAKDENLVATYLEWFEQLWLVATVVTAGRGS